MSKAHRDYFNQLAPEWNDKMPSEPRFREYLIRFGVRAGDRILDVGTGTGRMTKALIDLVGQTGLVVAQDIAEGMLEEGKKLLGDDHYYWLCDDVTALAMKDEAFEKVLCFSAFPHFSDQLKALREMSRVLRSGGRLLILHTSSSEELNAFHASLDGVVSGDRLPAAREMIPLLRQAGLEVEKAVDEQGLYWVEAVKC